MQSISYKVGLASLAACGVFAATAQAAGAPAGPPPPPTSTNGQPVQTVAQGGGLATPTSFAFGGGSVFEGDGGSETSNPPNGGVFVLKSGTATKLAGSPNFVAGLAWHKKTLYVSAATLTKKGPKFQILAWTGWNGTKFATRKAIYTAPKKFSSFNGLAFGPDGRLYAGVDVGFAQSNDHGPAGKNHPYLYDILSMKTNGKGLKVFASGMRQPWQMVFPGHSRSPYVSDLGQDAPTKVANKSPDFVLRVKAGQNYGFPQCNWVKAKLCKGFAKPWRFFTPHTDVMGLGIAGKRLYMSEFLGNQGQSGLVTSVPLHGKKGTPKTLLTGFVAPVVGLSTHHGWVYVGELTGQVFRVKAT